MVRRFSVQSVFLITLLSLCSVFSYTVRANAQAPKPTAPRRTASVKPTLKPPRASSGKTTFKKHSLNTAKRTLGKTSPSLVARVPAKPAVKPAIKPNPKPAPKPPAKPKPAAKKPATPAPDNLEATAVEIIANGKGRINYEVGVVKAVGMGAIASPSLKKTRAQDVLDAREVAVADALRNLSMAVSQVRVTAETRVENYVLKSDEIRVRVEALIRGAAIIEERVLPTSKVYRVVMQLRLTGPDSILDAIEAAENRARGAVASAPSVRRDPLDNAIPRYAPGSPAPNEAEYTSLIVDCRGLRVVAIPAPKLYDANGREVYGTVRVTPEYVNEVGIVSYPRSLDEARRSARAGNRPLMVRARGVSDGSRFHPVISHQDAERVLRANESGRFFERTAVIFLVDPL